MTFTPQPPVAPALASNTWVLDITDSASAGALIASYELVFNTGAADGGTLASVTALVGAPYDGPAGTLPLTVAGATITMEIGKLGQPNGMTQLDSTFAPTALAKDGSAVGNLLGVEIETGGIVRAVYDSGFTRPIFQVPIIDVRNPNGLKAGDNQTYFVSPDSGEMFLWDAGTGPVGETVGFAREASTTDVAQELTQLIQTQRAYSSNAKVIQTVDEMLQETTNLKR
jgi:flagellar hook protein FlgE